MTWFTFSLTSSDWFPATLPGVFKTSSLLLSKYFSYSSVVFRIPALQQPYVIPKYGLVWTSPTSDLPSIKITRPLCLLRNFTVEIWTDCYINLPMINMLRYFRYPWLNNIPYQPLIWVQIHAISFYPNFMFQIKLVLILYSHALISVVWCPQNMCYLVFHFWWTKIWKHCKENKF